MAPALFWRSARHHHDEFFATESRADIEHANGSAEDLGNVAYEPGRLPHVQIDR
jgi:hypothetical protein